jgi:hypothetical protein
MVALWPYTDHMTQERSAEAKTNLRVSPDVLEAMRRLARVNERSLNKEIVMAMREYVERHQRDAEQTAKQAS